MSLKKKIKNALPPGFKKAIGPMLKKRYWNKDYDQALKKFSDLFYKERLQAEQSIPSVDVEQRHIQNCKVILNRATLLSLLPKNAVCAEIGVDKGEFSEQILAATTPAKLHLIDVWGDPGRYHDGLKLQIEEKFKNQIQAKTIEINLGYSTDVLANMPDAYFDWVYLDTDHSYKTTAQELKLLNRKLKPAGIICGHDYIMGNWVGGIRYGVMEAVHEFCVKENWELIYITINKNESPSFAIKRKSKHNIV